MNQLRWVLALLGVVFIVGLFFWERRKRARGLGSLPRTVEPPAAAEAPSGWEGGASRDVPLSLPEIRAREPVPPLPVIGLDRDAEEVAAPASAPPAVQPASPPPASPPPAPPAAGPAPEIPGTRTDPGALRLEWPQESVRRIVAVRVVPITERFAGRSVRQALAGEGFVHGPLDIFHRPLPDGRVVLSAANLTKPGSFDPATMDSQRFAGLNLFAVLPGPSPALDTLEDLLTVARTLASRLSGLVQDDRGQPLDARRIAELKAALVPGAPPAEDAR